MTKIYTLYTRYEDGGVPVTIQENGEGKRKRYILTVGEAIFKSVKDFLKLSKSRATSSFTNYFGAAKPVELPIFDILKEIEGYKKRQLEEIEQDYKDVCLDTKPLTVNSDPQVVKGFDIVEKKKDIERIFYKFYAKRAAAEGLPVEDLLQEVFAGIISRNSKKSAFSLNRGSFSGYLHLVIGSIYKNFRKRELDRGVHDRSIKTKLLEKGEEATTESDFINDAILMDSFKEWVKVKKGMGDLASNVTVLLSEGKKKKEIADELGINATSLHKIIKGLQAKVIEFLETK